jgi:TonB family protein
MTPREDSTVRITLFVLLLLAAAGARSAEDEPLLAGVGGATYPELIHHVRPAYPLEAVREGVESRVILRAVVKKNGGVGELEVVSCDREGLGFEDAALEAVRQWRYNPAEQQGHAVDVYFTVRVDFEIESRDDDLMVPRGNAQNPAVDALARAVLTEIGAVPAKCPFDPFSVQFCGKLPHKKTPTVLEAKNSIDAILADGGAELTAQAWTTEKRIESHQWRVGSVPVIVQFNTRSRHITVSYPMQSSGCNEEGVDLPYDSPDQVSMPTLIKESAKPPSYPELARMARIESTVILQALVRRDGTVDNLCILMSNRPNLGFEKAAVEAVRRWRYEPATFEGEPVQVYFTVRVDFELRSGPTHYSSFFPMGPVRY